MSDSQNPTISDDIDERVRRLLAEDLIFPDGVSFCSRAPASSYKQVMEMSLLYLPVFNARDDFIKIKLSRPFTDPFKLY